MNSLIVHLEEMKNDRIFLSCDLGANEYFWALTKKNANSIALVVVEKKYF